jgi:hypothetical protein
MIDRVLRWLFTHVTLGRFARPVYERITRNGGEEP